MSCNLPTLWTDEEWLTKNPERISPVQININEYIRQAQALFKDKKILHIGIGNSSVGKQFPHFKRIDGLTNTEQEARLGRSYYHSIYLGNKYDLKFLSQLGEYDVVVDVSLKSFACCMNHWHDYLKMILNKLVIGGRLISHTGGFGGYISPKYGVVMDNSLTLAELYELVQGFHLFELKHLSDKIGYPFIIEKV